MAYLLEPKCAITIPCVAAALGVAIAIAVLKGGSAASSTVAGTSLANQAAYNSSLPPSESMINASIDKLNAFDEVPINPQPQPQPVTQNIIQPKPVEVQPGTQVTPTTQVLPTQVLPTIIH